MEALTDSSVFDFYGTMTEETLRAYLSKSITALGFCAEGNRKNIIFDEDLRFVLESGAKFISRAALFAWTTIPANQVEPHFKIAKEYAKKVHDADPQIILNAFTAEIVHKSCVEGIKVPDWVFKAFDMEIEYRNFIFDDIINKEKGPNYWMDNSGYPDYSNLECQMWYYYCNCRYIDCGYECIHMQESADDSEIEAVDKVLTLSRKYAKKAGRRGLVLFHSFFKSETGGDKIGERLLFDIHGNGLVPHRTVYEDGVHKCEIKKPGKDAYTWFGTSAGGISPLGFEVEINPTILELDNYGSHPDFAAWGYDDITWFSMQPEWYRNEFLWYVENTLASNYRTSDGKRSYYFLLTLRRCIIPKQEDAMKMKYVPGKNFNQKYFDDYCEYSEERIIKTYDGESYTLIPLGTYHSNNQSDICPNGSNQEDTIKAILAKKN